MPQEGIITALKDIFLFDTHTKRGLQKFYSFIFILLVIFYLHSFLFPIEISPWVNTNLIYLAIIIFYFAPALAEKLFFARDALQYGIIGKDPYSTFFQQQFPSKYIMQKFNIEENKASMYWFSIFNKWKSNDHPLNTWRNASFERGYSCRVIYYLQIWSYRFLLLSIIHLAFIVIFQLLVTAPKPTDFHTISQIELISWKIGYPIVMLIIYSLIKANNRINGNVPTGVWRKWKEINDIMKEWLDKNASSMNDLQDLSK